MPTSRIPLISSTSTFTVATPNDRLTIVAKKGDVAVVSSTGKSYIMSGSDPALEASWTLIGGTPAQDTIVAKGDILVGTDVKTFAPLTVGSDGQILSADSNEATGLKWTSVAGAAGAFPAYAQSNEYKSGDTVRHNGGLFSANADIPANTVFTLGSMGVTWSPLITGVWSNIVAGRNQVVIPSTTGVTLQDTTGVYKGVVDSTGFSVKNGSVSRIAASNTFTFLASPTINKSAILLTDLETSMLDATGVPLINLRQGAVTVQGRSGVDSKIVVGDSGVVIHGPSAELGLNLEAGAAQLKAPSANSNLWLTSTNANLSGPVGVPNISLDASASILAGPNGDTETQVKLTDTDINLAVGTNLRYKATTAESTIQFDSNNFVTAQSQRIIIYRMGFGVFDASSSSVTIGHDNGNKITFDNTNVVLKSNNDTTVQFSGTTMTVKHISVAANSIYNIGTTTVRHGTIHAVNALNTTSDATLKENIERLPDSLLDSWGKHVHPKQYNWVDRRVDDKKHISFIAQDIVAAFNEAGVDWKEYGVLSGNGEDEKFGVVYTEAQIIETAYQRRKIARQEAKLAELEAKLATLGL